MLSRHVASYSSFASFQKLSRSALVSSRPFLSLDTYSTITFLSARWLLRSSRRKGRKRFLETKGISNLLLKFKSRTSNKQPFLSPFLLALYSNRLVAGLPSTNTLSFPLSLSPFSPLNLQSDPLLLHQIDSIEWHRSFLLPLLTLTPTPIVLNLHPTLSIKRALPLLPQSLNIALIQDLLLSLKRQPLLTCNSLQQYQ